MTRFALSLVFVLVASFASAQTVEREINLSAFNWGPITIEAVETDGNLATEEWLVQRISLDPEWRIIAVRDGGLCIGDWFDPRPADKPWAAVRVARIGLTHKLLVASGAQLFTNDRVRQVRLETPACAPN